MAEEKKKEALSKRVYKNSPKIERGEDGKLKVNKGKKEEQMQAGTDGAEVNGTPDGAMPVPARHVLERQTLGAKHEMEHSMHKGDKKLMHERHEKERKEMHARHEKELAGEGGKAEPHAEEHKEGEKDKKGAEKELKPNKDKE